MLHYAPMYLGYNEFTSTPMGGTPQRHSAGADEEMLIPSGTYIMESSFKSLETAPNSGSYG